MLSWTTTSEINNHYFSVEHGTFAYSKIVATDTPDGRQIRFYTNPGQSLLTLKLAEASLTLVDVSVINASAQQVMTKSC